jgi:uncharacterized protein
MTTPMFRKLDSRASRALLKRNVVGRIAYLDPPRVNIEPISYVADGDWLYMRMAEGSKLTALQHRPYVALEVDEVRGMFDWRSVVVHGTVYFLTSDGPAIEARAYHKAVAKFRALIPDAFTDSDPAAFRNYVCGLHIDEVEGRSATTGPSA